MGTYHHSPDADQHPDDEANYLTGQADGPYRHTTADDDGWNEATQSYVCQCYECGDWIGFEDWFTMGRRICRSCARAADEEDDADDDVPEWAEAADLAEKAKGA